MGSRAQEPIDYRDLAPSHQVFRCCPMCTSELHDEVDTVNHRLRPTCPDCGWIYYPPNTYGSLAVVEHEGGIVLIRPDDCPPEAPAALPGGIAEYAETPEDCAIREVEEETGLEVALTAELDRFLVVGGLGPMLMFGFVARVTGGRLRTDGDEGPAAIHGLDALPSIDPGRRASVRILDAYLASRR
ncbi:MAG TPA: NUDIX hydrolase [Actinopolymorphaceae bacterium]